MTNLLTETLEAIEKSGHTVDDIQFIGSADAAYRCTWQEFESMADVEYHSGFGAAHVATDLIVRFADGRKLWRGEYDGSEWWEFDAPGGADYSAPGKQIKVVVTSGLWQSVADLNVDAEPTRE